MLILSIVLFLMAVSLGFYLLINLLSDKNTHKKAALMHGALALSGLIMLIAYCLLHHVYSVSIIILCLAAVGGVFLFVLGHTGKKIPKPIAMIHAVAALSGLAILLLFVKQLYF